MEELKKWFGGSTNLKRNVDRLKADKQGRHVLEWFVTSEYDWLVTLDSDLIMRPDRLELMQGMLPKRGGSCRCTIPAALVIQPSIATSFCVGWNIWGMQFSLISIFSQENVDRNETVEKV